MIIKVSLYNTFKDIHIRIKKELNEARLFFKEKYALFIEELEKKANEVNLKITSIKSLTMKYCVCLSHLHHHYNEPAI